MAGQSGALINLRLSGGRPLWSFRYVVSHTYEGLMLGTPNEFDNEMRLKECPDVAARYFVGLPVHVIRPTRPSGVIEFPRVRVIASFESRPIGTEGHWSSLAVVWFQNEPAPIPDESSRAALEAIEWEQLASDYQM